MNTISLAKITNLSAKLSEKIPYLKMLVLFGSRATGDVHAKSDWDFAALYDEKLRKQICQDKGFAWFEVPLLLGEIFEINSDQIDVVDLNHCSPITAHFAARDGKLVYEKESGEFESFRKRAFKKDTQIEDIRKSLREKVEQNLQKRGV